LHIQLHIQFKSKYARNMRFIISNAVKNVRHTLHSLKNVQVLFEFSSIIKGY